MNMNESPHIDELQSLFARCDDRKGHHVLWVSCTGEVAISEVDGAIASPPMTNVRLRYEMFSQGTDNVGPTAANDMDHMNRMFNSLEREWTSAGLGDEEIYIHQF